MRINGHGHILPEPSQIPKFLKDKKLFWIDDDKKFMRQGDWSRPISSENFFIDENNTLRTGRVLDFEKNQIVSQK